MLTELHNEGVSHQCGCPIHCVSVYECVYTDSCQQFVFTCVCIFSLSVCFGAWLSVFVFQPFHVFFLNVCVYFFSVLCVRFNQLLPPLSQHGLTHTHMHAHTRARCLSCELAERCVIIYIKMYQCFLLKGTQGTLWLSWVTLLPCFEDELWKTCQHQSC